MADESVSTSRIEVLLDFVNKSKDGVDRAIQGFQRVKKAVDNVEEKFKSADKASKQFGDNTDQAAKSTERLGTSSNKASHSVDRLTTATKKSKAELKDSTKFLDSFDKSLKGIKFKSSPQIRQEIGLLKENFRKLAASGELSAQDLARAYQITQRRIKSLNNELVKTSKLGKNFGGMIGGITALVATLAGLRELGIIIQDLITFDDAIRSAGAVAQASASQLNALEAAAREMGATTRYTATESAETLKFLAMAGFTVEESIGALPEVLKLASAGMMDLAKAGDIVTNVMTGYGFEVEDLVEINDVLVASFTNANTNLTQLGTAFQYAGPIAKSAGMEFKETATILSALAQGGYRGSKAGTILRGALNALLKPSSMSRKAIEKLGLQILDSTGNMRPFMDILEDIRRSGATTTDILQIFGRVAGPGLATLLGLGDEALRELFKTIDESAGIGEKVSKEMEAGIGGVYRTMASTFESMRLAIGKTVEPKVIEFFKQLTQAMRDGTDEISVLVGLFVSILGVILQVTTAIGLFSVENYKLIGLIIGLTTALWGLGKASKYFLTLNMIGGFKGLLALKFSPFIRNIGLVVDGFAILRAGIAKFLLSIRTLVFAHPVLAATAAALMVVVAAIKIFRSNSSENAKEQANLASTLGETKKQLDANIDSLESAREALNENESGTTAYIAAQQTIARLIPGVTLQVDEQGRILAKVGEQYKESTEIVGAYIDKLKSEAALTFALQIEAQTKALNESTKALKQYKKDLEDWYGIGVQDSDLQWYDKVATTFWRTVNKLTGTYDKNIAKGADLRKSHEEISSGFNELIESAIKAGIELEEFESTLRGAKIDESIIDKVLKEYDSQSQAANKAKESSESAAQASKQAAEEIQRMEEQQKYLNELQKESASIQAESSERQLEASAAGQRALSSTTKYYKQANNEIIDSHRRRLEAILTITEAEISALNKTAKSYTTIVAESTRIRISGYQRQLDEIKRFTNENIALKQQEYTDTVQIAQKLGKDTRSLDINFLETKRDSYKQAVASYRSMINSMIAEENRHLDIIKSVEDQRRQLKLSTEDRVRELRRSVMGEEQAREDTLTQIAEKQAAAREAIAKGEFDQAQKFAEQASALVDQTILKESDEEGITSGMVTASVNRAATMIQENAQIIDRAYVGIEQAHKSAADQLRATADEFAAQLDPTEAKIGQINQQITSLSEGYIQLDSSELDVAVSKLDEINSKLRDLEGKIINVKITTETAGGTTVVPGYQTGGEAGSWPRRIGQLFGFGGGDKVKAMVEKGEYINDKTTVSKLGSGFFRALPSLANKLSNPKLLESAITQGISPMLLAAGSQQFDLKDFQSGNTNNKTETNNTSTFYINGNQRNVKSKKILGIANELLDVVSKK